jgi:NADPH2:quinone reductase
VKAIRFHAVGGPDVLVYEDAADPTPGPGMVVVRVRAAGVNFADTRFRRGEYFVRPQLPDVPGLEAAGEVVLVGPNVTWPSVGMRVMALGARAYAEHMVVRASDVYAMPDALSFETAAALPVQGLTAHHVLALSGRLRPGERVLVHAGAGGVGSLAIQLAKRMGASLVIATAGSREKLALASELGADVTIDYRTEDLVARVKQATGNRGVDVLLEMIGGTDALVRNLACLAPFGRMVVYGAASGDTKGTIEPVSLMAKNASVIGYYLTPLTRQRELCEEPLRDLASAASNGALRVVIGGTYPLARAADAHRALEERQSVGKLVLVP